MKFKNYLAISLTCFLLIISFSVRSQCPTGNILYVDAGVSSSGDGTTWSGALKTLKEALDIANSCNNIETIAVAEGTYYPTGNQNGTDRDATFYISRYNLKLVGGYPSGGGVRNIQKHPVVLSGDIGQSGDITDNSYHIMVISAFFYGNLQVVVDGFNFQWGYANGSGSKDFNGNTVERNRGGAVYSHGSYAANLPISDHNIVLANCTFKANYAGDSGGAYFSNGAAERFMNCLFSGNDGNYGGAICFYYYSVPAINQRVESCTLAGNNVRHDGGGVIRVSNTTIDIVNTIIYGNFTSGNSTGISNNGAITNFTYSLIQGQTTTANGNIPGTTNPLFINNPLISFMGLNTGQNYHLNANSPCVNKGDNSAATGNDKDLDGNPRVYSCTIDMGAYEATDQSLKRIIYVKQGGTGNGSSWATATGDLQGAINNSCSGSEIWVAAGTYKPNRPADNLNTIAPNNRTNSFVLKKDVKMYGGFPATGNPSLTNRDWNANETILSGDIGVTGNDDDNTYHVIFCSGYLGTTELDGFTITKGNANHVSDYYYNTGAGAFFNNTNVPIKNCKFIENKANVGGGALYLLGSANPDTIDISSCSFYNNYGNHGGAISTVGGNLTIRSVIFYNNQSSLVGGAVNSEFSSISIVSSQFSSNSADKAGGAIFLSKNTGLSTNNFLNINLCSFAQNSSGDLGGAVSSEGNIVKITSSTFIGNQTTNLGQGGALNMLGNGTEGIGSADITNSLFKGNSVPTSIGNLTGFSGGAISLGVQGSVTNCTIVDNSAYNGGGISYFGGAVITNNIIYNNIGGNISFDDDDDKNNISYCLLNESLPGRGNIVGNPLFVDPANNNYQLMACSPAINAGNNNSIPSGLTSDLGGKARIIQNTVDIGAYEFLLSSNPKIEFFVDGSDGSDFNTGRDWTNPLKTLTEALKRVQESTCYNTEVKIYMTGGIYYPTGSQNSTNRDSTFLIKRGNIKIYGSCYPYLNNFNRDFVNNPTILSGDIGTAGDNSDNSYHVMVIAGIGAAQDSIILDGLTISNGKANGSGSNTFNGEGVAQSNGGGLFIKNVNNGQKTVLVNCTVSGNQATSSGGGIFNNTASPGIYNCLFTGNAASSGGGITNFNTSSPLIVQSTFSANNSGANGAVNNGFSSNPQIFNSIIWGNSSGLVNNNNSTPVVAHSLVQGGYAGEGNLDMDPLFANAIPATQAPTMEGDFRLLGCSPAINTGDNSKVPVGLNLDIIGNQRVFKSNVDMGAYEASDALNQSLSFYVAPESGSDDNDGYSWATAFKTLSFALSKAQAAGCFNSEVKIYLTKGVYYPTGTGNSTDREKTFLIQRGNIKIYGGYPFGGGARDIASYPSTLSGDIGTAYDNSDNSYHVVVIAGIVAAQDSIILDGLTISNGKANGSGNNTFNGESVAQSNGGGLFIKNINNGQKTVLVNCTVSGNQATSSGGGIFSNAASPGIYNCLITGNRANAGGGITNFNASSTVIVQTTIASNATGLNGAVNNNTSSNPQIYNSIIYGNGSGIVNVNNSVPVVAHSIVQGGYEGEGNLDMDPLFVNAITATQAPAMEGDFRLLGCSPAINSGDNSKIPTGLNLDISLNQRILQGAVDMGAYEASDALNQSLSFYVAPESGSDDNDGHSWATAFKTLSFALSKAQSAGCFNSEVNIYLTKGVYFPTGTGNSTDREKTFLIQRGNIKIYGGYPFGGGARDLASYPSVLSGDIGTVGDNSDNSYHVVVIAGIGAAQDSIILDGLTISNGKANGSGSNTFNGEGVAQSNGGGLFIKNVNNGQKTVLVNCTVSGNQASGTGGGIFNRASSIAIYNCLFSGNNATVGGAALDNLSASSPVIHLSTFTGNNGGNEGAIRTIDNSTFKMYNSIVWGNSSGIVDYSSNAPIVQYSDIQDGYTGTGNISADPLFVNTISATQSPTTAGNFSLTFHSPAINAGNNTLIPDDIAFDIIGNARIFQNAVDMGAFEYSINITLPVTLTDFTAQALGQTVLLKWQTAQEINSGQYLVYRSGDGRNFSQIGVQQAQGNTSDVSDYTYTDNTPLDGRNFYRLVLVDLDGKHTDLGIRMVNFANVNSQKIKIYPNPSGGVVNLSFATNSFTKVSITDISGKILQSIDIQAGESHKTISLAGHAAGTYMLTFVKEDGSMESVKVVKQ